MIFGFIGVTDIDFAVAEGLANVDRGKRERESYLQPVRERCRRRRESMKDQVLNLISARKGHFLLESGHHGDLWLDLELLCLRPDLLSPLIAELATRLLPYNVDLVCGPLVEGALIALLVSAKLGARFCYSERVSISSDKGLFPAMYRLPHVLRTVD